MERFAALRSLWLRQVTMLTLLVTLGMPLSLRRGTQLRVTKSACVLLEPSAKEAAVSFTALLMIKCPPTRPCRVPAKPWSSFGPPNDRMHVLAMRPLEAPKSRQRRRNW